MMNVLDLFSGIGGFSLGLESTGFFKTIAFVEKDRFCQKVLQKNFPNVPIEDEIRNVRGEKYKADVVTGGFPCQPFSVAGKRKSRDDDRYLWDEMLRVIAETKPKWIVGENVAGIINIENGKVLQQIQKDLESEGFQVQCLVIPASGVGAWHQRKRVWIIGHNVSNSKNRIRKQTEWQRRKSFRRRSNDRSWLENERSKAKSNVSNSDSRLRGRRTAIGESGENEVRRIYSSEEEQARNDVRSKAIGCDAVSGKTENVSNSNAHERYNLRGQKSEPTQETQQRFGISCNATGENLSNSNTQRTQIQAERKYSGEQMSGSSSKERRIKKLSNSSSKRLEMRYKENSTLYRKDKRRYFSELSSEREKKSWWQTQSELCGVPDGIQYGLDKDRTNRIKALGNSIVPQIAFEIGRAIIRAEEQQT